MLFLVVALVSVLLIWAVWIEPGCFQISRHAVTLKKKAKLSKPLRILHLSDIHFAGHRPELARFFDQLALEPVDLVVISGDIIDHENGIEHAVTQFKKLKPAHGIYAVLGNHDYYDYQLKDTFSGISHKKHPKKKQNSEKFITQMEEAGIRVFRNQKHEFDYLGSRVCLYGLDDPITGHADLEHLKTQVRGENINLLLTHSVNVLRHLEDGLFAMSFSGHSHGGQVLIPGFGAIITHTQIGREYVSGVKLFKGTVCSISRGMGQSRFLRLRFLCRPEAILLEVTSERE